VLESLKICASFENIESLLGITRPGRSRKRQTEV
jgi:hypothetical protein